MNTISDNNFNFFEKKKKNRVRVVTASPEELERQSFNDTVNGVVNKSLSSLNKGVGEMDDKIKNALKSNGSDGTTDDYYDSKSKKTNSVVAALSKDLQTKLNKTNAIDPKSKKMMDDFLSSLGKGDGNIEDLVSLGDILSAFKKSYDADAEVSAEFLNFLRSLKKLLESLQVKNNKVMLNLSAALELLNSEDLGLNGEIEKFLKGLIFGDTDSKISDNIISFFNKIRKIKSIKDTASILLARLFYARKNIDFLPVNVYEFTDYGITDSNVPKLIEDSNISRILVDYKDITDYINLIGMKSPISDFNKSDVSLPVWANESWRSNTEKRLKEFYKVSRSKETGVKGDAPEWTKNEYVNTLNSLLNPAIKSGTDAMNPGIDPDEFARLIVQSYYTSDHKTPVVRSNVQLKNGVMIPKEIKMTEFDTKDFVEKNFFEIGEDEFVKIFTQATRDGSSLYNNLNGHVLLPHIQVSPENNITHIGDVIERQEAAANMATQHAVHSSAVKCLLRKMPDFRPNMYYGVLSQYNEDDERITDILSITGNMPFEKELGVQLAQILQNYFVRLQRLSINGMSIEPTTWDFMGRQVSKVSSTFTESHKTELEFSLDQNGLILNKFNALAGIFGSNLDDTVKFEGDIENNYYSQTFFPSTFFTNKSRIDLTIMYNDFNTTDVENHFSSYGATQKLIMNNEQRVLNAKQNKTYGFQSSYRAFVFEDIRFLGSNSTLKFERDAGGRISSVVVPILYKRISTIDNNF